MAIVRFCDFDHIASFDRAAAEYEHIAQERRLGDPADADPSP